MLASDLSDLLRLALAEQGRRPDRAQPVRAPGDDLDPDRFGQALSLVQPRLGRAPAGRADAFAPGPFGHDQNRALAAGDVKRSIAIEIIQARPPLLRQPVARRPSPSPARG